MHKFKVGDRVRFIGQPDECDYGQIGTVCDDSTAPWVRMDEPTRYGYEGNQPFWKTGYMECFHEDDLELAPGMTVDNAIRAYGIACEAFEAAQLALEKAKQDVADARLNLRDALDADE